MDQLKDRRVLVTGGTSGIGLATAELLASSGASVFVLGLCDEKLAALTARTGIQGVTCDVREFAACEQAVAAANLVLGGVDAVVSSAGVGICQSILDLSPDDFQLMMDTNVTGTFNICKAALPGLLASPRADVVTVGSRAGRYAFATGTGYCASKSAVQGFSEALYLDLMDRGVAVSMVAPGPVATGFAGADMADWQLTPHDVAEAIVSCLQTGRGANLNWVEMRPSRRDA